jgi:hypothetical protein
MAKVGRPKIELDRDQIFKLARLHCTIKEIADFFDVDRDTISDNYSAEIKKGRADGRIRLRKKQFDLAMSGNVSMCIWLGKQVLDQNEKHINEDDMPQPLIIEENATIIEDKPNGKIQR